MSTRPHPDADSIAQGSAGPGITNASLLREDLATVLDAAGAAWFQARLASDSVGRPSPWSALGEQEKATIRARVEELLSGRVEVRHRADQAAVDVALALGSVRVSWKGRVSLIVTTATAEKHSE